MKLVRDEPQQLLVLEAPVVALPPQALGCVGVVVLGIFVGIPGFDLIGPLVRGERPDPPSLGLSLLFPLAGAGVALFILFRLRAMARYVQRIRVDRYGGELELVDQGVLGGSSSTLVRLDQVQRIVAASALVKPSIGDFKAGAGSRVPRLGLRLRIEWTEEGGRPRTRSAEFPVDDLDKREEVADFAYRLARAAGLFYARVVRSDPRDLEIELTRDRGQGSEPVPLIEAPAEYAKDRVVSQAARVASEEHVAAFVPSEFRGELAVETWEPRREVRFRKGLGFGAIGCLPFTLLVLSGPLFYLYASPRPEDRLVVSAFLGLFGLLIGGIAVGVVVTSLPRRVGLDWTTGSLEWRGVFRTRSVALSDIRELELKCVRQYHSSKNSSYHSYRAEIVAHLRAAAPGAAGAETIVRTIQFREDPDTPYRMGLPLATELAAALHVPRRVTDFS